MFCNFIYSAHEAKSVMGCGDVTFWGNFSEMCSLLFIQLFINWTKLSDHTHFDENFVAF